MGTFDLQEDFRIFSCLPPLLWNGIGLLNPFRSRLKDRAIALSATSAEFQSHGHR
jgi:hypothetical protein